MHQGSAYSSLLFVIVMEALYREFRVALPWELLYADDPSKGLMSGRIMWRKEDSVLKLKLTDLGHMDVQVSFLQEVVVRVDLRQERFGNGVCDLCALLHYVSEVTGHVKMTARRRVFAVRRLIQRPC